jgi:hypothetical protein
MAREQLPLGQIQPAARPVSSFVQPGLIETARPAQPQQINLSSDRIGLVQTAAAPNVQGYDQGEQLARALAPFSQNLTKLMNYGVQLYASNEYQQGQNEALKAYTIANRQLMVSADEYAAENRDVARQDPVAGLLMDRANPFRTAGRQNQLSKLASVEMPMIMRREFNQRRADLALLDPADPKVNAVKAAAIAQVSQKFGLSEFTPGFMDYVLPRMNSEWDKITQDQIDDHNKYLDETVPRIAAATIYGRVKKAMADGVPLAQIVANETSYLDQEARRFGIPGKGQEMKETAIKNAISMAMDPQTGVIDREARAVIGSILVGPPDSNGYRPTAQQMYALEILEATDRTDQMNYRARKAQQEAVDQRYADEVAGATLGLPDGPEKAARLEQIRGQYQGQLPLSEMLKIEQSTTNVTEDITSRGFADDAGAVFLQEADAAYGSDWDPAQFDRLFQLELQQVAPEKRAQFSAQYAEVRRRKETQKQNMPDSLISGAIARQVKANLEANYPDTVTAAVRGARNIEELMATGDANAAASAARQNAAFRTSIYRAIDAKRAELDRDLTPAEQQQVIDSTLTGFQKNAPATWKTLFPGTNGQPSTVPFGTTRPGADRPEPPKPPPGRRAQGAPTFGVAQLDAIPNREQRLQNWRGEAVLSASETARLIPLALGGQSLPAPLNRAAKAAGTSPQQFLLQQADFYPNDIKLTPAQRSQLGRSGQQARATQSYSQQVAAAQRSSQSPLAAAGMWALDAITGTAPAYAGSMQNFSARGQAMATTSGSTNLLGVIKDLRGANSFRGISLIKNKRPGDYQSHPRENWFFDFNPSVVPLAIKRAQRLTEQDVNALVFTALTEAGPTMRGKLEVAANLINRSAVAGNKPIVDIAKAPGQYEGVFRYTRGQVISAAEGRRIFGSLYDQVRDQIRQATTGGKG